MEKISREVAEAEFDRFAESMRLKININDMDEEDAKSFKPQKEKIIDSMLRGDLVIDEKGQPQYTVAPNESSDTAKVITFYQPTGLTLSSMDRAKKTEEVKKLYIAMANMTKMNVAFYNSMPLPDLQICMAVTTLFLG